jgi:hypothetical protein
MTARPNEKDEALPVAEPLDDPRPSIPADEAFARVDARIAEYKAKHGL